MVITMDSRLQAGRQQASVAFGKRQLSDFQKKYVIYGGTFDPLHNQHALIVEKVLQQFKPERLFLMPAADPPHKNGPEITDFKHRVAMLKEQYKDRKEVVVSEIENTLPKPSYTLNTLRALLPGFDNLYDTMKEKVVLVIGGDSKDKIGSWFGAQTLIKNTLFLVASRPKKPEELQAQTATPEPEGLEWEPIEIEESTVSSRDIRKKIREGISLEALKAFVPEAIAKYIFANNLYPPQAPKS